MNNPTLQYEKPTDGRVVTFYSYKGGVGRTFTLANVAYSLYSLGRKVLVLDWDLEAPGLERYFQNKLNSKGANLQLSGNRRDTIGILDLLHLSQQGASCEWRDALIHVRSPDVTKGTLDLIHAGQMTDNYNSTLNGLDWNLLFSDLCSFGTTLERWRAEWTETYDVVCIDSRTGITDIGGICTILLPDALVLVFTANEQSIEGVREVARQSLRKQNLLDVDRTRMLAIPLLGRDESQTEYEQSLKWKKRIASAMTDIYSDWLPQDVHPVTALTQLSLPYVPYWSFGERLPVFEKPEELNDPRSLATAFSRVATLLVNWFDWTSMGHLDSREMTDLKQQIGLLEREKSEAEMRLAERESQHINDTVAIKRRTFLLTAGISAAGVSTTYLVNTRERQKAKQDAILLAAKETMSVESKFLLLRELDVNLIDRSNADIGGIIRGLPQLRRVWSFDSDVNQVVGEISDDVIVVVNARDELLAAKWKFPEPKVVKFRRRSRGRTVCDSTSQVLLVEGLDGVNVYKYAEIIETLNASEFSDRLVESSYTLQFDGIQDHAGSLVLLRKDYHTPQLFKLSDLAESSNSDAVQLPIPSLDFIDETMRAISSTVVDGGIYGKPMPAGNSAADATAPPAQLADSVPTPTPTATQFFFEAGDISVPVPISVQQVVRSLLSSQPDKCVFARITALSGGSEGQDIGVVSSRTISTTIYDKGIYVLRFYVGVKGSTLSEVCGEVFVSIYSRDSSSVSSNGHLTSGRFPSVVRLSHQGDRVCLIRVVNEYYVYTLVSINEADVTVVFSLASKYRYNHRFDAMGNCFLTNDTTPEFADPAPLDDFSDFDPVPLPRDDFVESDAPFFQRRVSPNRDIDQNHDGFGVLVVRRSSPAQLDGFEFPPDGWRMSSTSVEVPIQEVVDGIARTTMRRIDRDTDSMCFVGDSFLMLVEDGSLNGVWSQRLSINSSVPASPALYESVNGQSLIPIPGDRCAALVVGENPSLWVPISVSSTALQPDILPDLNRDFFCEEHGGRIFTLGREPEKFAGYDTFYEPRTFPSSIRRGLRGASLEARSLEIGDFCFLSCNGRSFILSKEVPDSVRCIIGEIIDYAYVRSRKLYTSSAAGDVAEFSTTLSSIGDAGSVVRNLQATVDGMLSVSQRVEFLSESRSEAVERYLNACAQAGRRPFLRD